MQAKTGLLIRRVWSSAWVAGALALGACGGGWQDRLGDRPQLVEGQAKVIELHASEGMALLEVKRGRYWAFWDMEMQTVQSGTMLSAAPVYDQAPAFQQYSAIARAPVAHPTQFPAKEGDVIVFSGLLTNNEIYLRRVGVIK